VRVLQKRSSLAASASNLNTRAASLAPRAEYIDALFLAIASQMIDGEFEDTLR